MQTVPNVPPEIAQYFRSDLLSTPKLKFRDDYEVFLRIYLYIKDKLKKKCKTDISREVFKKLETEFLQVYDRAIVKEKELQNDFGNKAKDFFYRIQMCNKVDRDLFEGLRDASRKFK